MITIAMLGRDIQPLPVRPGLRETNNGLPCAVLLSAFKTYVYYLKGNVTERERTRKRYIPSIRWFTPQLVTVTGVRTG